jgi:RNA polymerase sigma factor
VIVLDLEIRRDILQVQQGKEDVRESIIKKYLPFILKVTARTCKRFIRLEEDDEASIALMAFNEALDKYNLEQNTSFFSFAETIIKRRIIDYFRKSQKGPQDMPWSSLTKDGEEEEDTVSKLDKLTWKESEKIHFEKEITELRSEEIVEYSVKLREYGIEFRDLVAVSPKHQDARVTAYQIAKIICENEIYRTYLLKKKTLPLKELEHEVKVSRKTLERQRKYIIALTIIILGEFYFLRDYLEGLKG